MNVLNFTVEKMNNIIKSEKICPLISFLFFVTEFVCGIDLGFNKYLSTKYGVVPTVASRFVLLLMLLLLILPNWETFPIWYILFILQYIGYFIARISTTFFFYDFIVKVFNINHWLIKSWFNKFIFVYTFIVITVKLFICLNYCENQKDSCYFELVFYVPKFLTCIPQVSVDTVPIFQIIVFYYLYLCVNQIKKHLSNNFDVKFVQEQYLQIVDSFDQVLSFHGKLLLVSLLVDGPRFMLKLYHSLFFIRIKGNWFYIFSQCVYTSCSIIHFSAPSVVAEMINTEMASIKKMLCVRLYVCADAKDSDEDARIISLLRFMKARPLRRKVWGIIPLDMRLPVTLFGLCATYIIVIIQMTHLYEK